MRKIKSKEYCHNCGEESDWLFEDRPGNQIIECPLCKHKHYRVVTGELVRPEIKYNGEAVTDVEAFLKEHPELKEEFQELEKEAEMRLEVSGRRWGQDPAQSQGGIQYSWANTGTTWLGSTSDCQDSSYVYSADNGQTLYNDSYCTYSGSITINGS